MLHLHIFSKLRTFLKTFSLRSQMNNIKHKQIQQNESVKETSNSTEESYEMKYTIDQQQR